MPEDNKITHEIIALKVKINLPRQSSSGLLVAYIDAARLNYLGSFSIVAVGQDLVREKLARASPAWSSMSIFTESLKPTSTEWSLRKPCGPSWRIFRRRT